MTMSQVLQNLNLSALASVNFLSGDKNKTIGEIVGYAPPRENLKINEPHFAALSDTSSPLRDWILLDFQPNTPSGFAAAAFQNPATGEIVFSFRGTENGSIIDWLRDFNTDAQIAIGGHSTTNPNQFYDAYDFVKTTLQSLSGDSSMTKSELQSYITSHNITYTGHSLGGGISQYLVYELGGGATTFNAVGIGQILPSGVNPNSSYYNTRIVDYVNQNDVIGSYGVQLGRTDFVEDSNSAARIHAAIRSALFGGVVGLAVNGATSLLGSHGLASMMHRNSDGTFSMNSLEPTSASADIYALASVLYGLSRSVVYTGGALNQGIIYSVPFGYLDDFRSASIGSVSGLYGLGNGLFYVGENLDGWTPGLGDATADAAFYALMLERGMFNDRMDPLMIRFGLAATTLFTRVDPLVLDLDGDGIETTNLVGSSAYFDLDANGFAERTGWVSGDDGLLVLDRNNNGRIDNGLELFGDQTLLQDGTRAASGFQALAEFDTNADGKIDASDAIFGELRVWQDINGDGISSTSEMKTLSELNIASISLSSIVTGATDVMDNIQQRLGSFVRTDASQGLLGEYLFNRDASSSYVVSGASGTASHTTSNVDIAFLPNLQGSGNVASLRSAMLSDTSGILQSLVEDFIAAPDMAARDVLLHQIIYRWAGSDAINPSSRGSNIDARQLVALEKFLGTNFVGVVGSSPNMDAAVLLRDIYAQLSEYIYASLAGRSFAAATIAEMSLTENGAINLATAIATIESELVIDTVTGTQSLRELTRILKGFGLAETEEFRSFRNHFALSSVDYGKSIDFTAAHVVTGTSLNNSLSAQATGSVLDGLDGDDTLRGSDRADILYGGNGDDILYGFSGDDILDGGEGNDILNGGDGTDTFIFGRGYGVDTIQTNSFDNSDRVVFKSGILPSDIVVLRAGANLEIGIAGTQDKLILQDYLNYRGSINRFEFVDGTVLTKHDIVQGISHLVGTNGDDTLTGGYGIDELIEGGDGNDTIHAYGGGDTVNPGHGDDTVFANGDTITYLYNLGDGKDLLNSSASAIEVRFGVDIAPDDVVVYRRASGGVIFEIVDGNGAPTGDRLVVQGLVVPEVYFDNGTIWSKTSLEAQLSSLERAHVFGTENDDILLSGSPVDKNTIHTGAGNDTVYVLAHDIIYNTSGNDTYRIDRNGSTVEIYNQNTTQNLDTLYLTGVSVLSDITIHNLPSQQAGIRIDINPYGPGHTASSVIYYSDYMPKILLGDGVTTMNATDIQNAIVPILDGTTGNDTLIGTAANDVAYGGLGDDILYGDFGDDRLYGEDGNDTLYGGAGNDMLYGGAGDNTLDGGAGDDLLYGEVGGSNTIVFDYGYGKDTVELLGAASQNPGGNTKVVLGANISPDDVQIVLSGTDSFLILLKNSTEPNGDMLYVKAGLNESVHGLVSIEFADATIWTKSDIEYQATQIKGTAGDDALAGFGNLNETITGGDGDDKLYAYGGHDTLNPGHGNDFVSGYSGSATYVYSRGDGEDTLDGSMLDGVDIVLGAGIDPTHTILKRLAGDTGYVLEFADTNGNETGDRIVIRSGTEPTVHFADSTVWEFADIVTAAAQLETIYAYGTTWNDILNGDTANNIVYAGAGNDTVTGGAGNDTIYSASGNDTYIFNRGDGRDVIHDTGGTTDLDVIQLGEGITASDIVVYSFAGAQPGIRVEIKGMYGAPSTDSVTYYSDRVPEIHFANSTVMSQTDITTAAIPILSGTSGDDVLQGTSGNDTIYAGNGNDELYGGAGNDALYGETGTNILDGGAGDDALYVNANGTNTILFGRGSGFDTIRFDGDPQQPLGTASIMLGAGITPQDLLVVEDGSMGFYIGIKDGNDYPDILWVPGGFGEVVQSLLSIQFADSTVWTGADIWVAAFPNMGSEGDDMLLGNMYTADNDTLIGNGGNDTLVGYMGNNTLDGGLGDDMYGTFYGEGSDTIIDSGGTDTVVLMAVLWSSIIFERIGDDLQATSASLANYTMVVKDHYDVSGDATIESIVDISGGMSITHTQVDQLIQAMATFSTTNNGMTWAQALQSNPQDVQSVVSQYWSAPTA